jgi:hypothetical protein
MDIAGPNNKIFRFREAMDSDDVITILTLIVTGFFSYYN